MEHRRPATADSLAEPPCALPAGVADVPSELQRQFGLMRELDERAYRLQQQVDTDMVTQLKAAAERQQGEFCRPPDELTVYLF